MEKLIKRINKKNFQEFVHDKFEKINSKVKKNQILNLYNNKLINQKKKLSLRRLI